MPEQLTMYTTTWCGFCRNLKNQLAREGIELTEVDIERDPAAAEFVMSVNGGNQTVPTLLFLLGSVYAVRFGYEWENELWSEAQNR